MTNSLQIVNNFFEYLGKGDFNKLESIIDEQVKFIGPVDQKTGKNEFIQLQKGFGPMVQGMKMKKQFTNGSDVCSIYTMTIKKPDATNFLEMEIADWIKTKNGKMVEQRIYYDSRKFLEYMS